MHIDYFFDPVCPFCWVTAKWVRLVQPHRRVTVDWRFISLKVLNENRSYDGRPPGALASHTKGRDLLRIAAAVKDALGGEPVGELYREFGERIWEAQPQEGLTRYEQNGRFGSNGEILAALAASAIPSDFATAADDPRWDEVLRAETEAALERTGPNVGTPIITYGAPDGPSYFGPVISQVPDLDDSLRLWDAVVTLGEIETFAEVKRSMREPPQLRLITG